MARVPGFGSAAQPILPKSERYAQFRAQQQAVFQQHKQFSAELEQKAGQVKAKQGDLDIAGRLFKILDSRVPKVARQFLTKELAGHMGVDPKSEQFQGVSQVLTGLDPDSLAAMKQQVASQLEGAPPGEIEKQVKGILTGQIPMDTVVGQMAQAMQVPDETMSGGGGTEQLSGGAAEDDLSTPATQSTQAKSVPTPAASTTTDPQISERVAAEPFQGGAGTVKSFEGQRTIPPAAQQASPTLVGALGLDSKQRYRNEDLIKAGYRMPFDPKDQEELAKSIVTRSVGLSNTITEAAMMTDLFKGRPETLGPVGGVVRGIQSTVRQVEGVLNLIKPGATNESDPNDAYTQGLARRIGAKLAKTHGLDATAEDAARIQSAVLGLAYRMAIARDIPGNRLTNAIINQHLTQIGQSASPEQFKATLTDTLTSLTREFDETMKRQLGVSGMDIVTRQLTDDDIVKMSKSADIIPIDFATSLHAEAKRRQSGQPGPAITPASPTLEEEERTLGGLEVQDKERKIAKTSQEMDIQRETAERQARGEDRAMDREERVVAQNERSAQLQRESFEYRKAQDVKEEDEKRRLRIERAFAHFGNAMSSRSSGGISGGGFSTPQQDVSAFRITPPPQRQAPRSK